MKSMKIGVIGLGKMGGQIVTRLLNHHHEVVAMDVSPTASLAAKEQGATIAADYKNLLALLDPVIIWLMLPSEIVDQELEVLLPLLPKQSIIVDGGNSDFRKTLARSKVAAAHEVYWVDAGVSGGILGLEKGFSIMVGGDKVAVDKIEPIFKALASEGGWYHFGGPGSGHYVKMVHNAIEYGLMESYAEGYRLLKEGPYHDINLAAAGEVWQRGSIIESLLGELTREVLEENSELNGIDGVVTESGEARWALQTALDSGIKLPAIEASFDVRTKSQSGQTNYATKLLAAMRNKFGGHSTNPK